ncbi:MAG: DNA helicase II [Pseudomonadota bacterium]
MQTPARQAAILWDNCAMNSSLLSGLNPEQLSAVTLPPQSALILAGAGSGKTRVLTTRIAWLISTGQVSPHGILAVTFTNKAAKEMLARLAAMLPINIRGMWMGTFHGLCNRLLRTHHREANLPQTFQILDSGDQLGMIKRVMKALNVDDEKFPPRDVQNFISGSKEQGLRAHEVEAFDPYTRRKVEIYAAYDEQCQREGVVDFAELLLRCHELLSRDQSLREHYQTRFRHILVDEFQDTNTLQYQWLKLLAGQHNALFAVGDDDQSIYAFRGANVGNMQQLTRDFHVQNVIKLEQNYRSHGNILDAANALIRNNSNRLGKNLWTAADKGEALRVYEAPTDTEEARFITEEVQQLHREGINLSGIAVLYRSNAQSRVIEHALVSAGIAYRVYGGQRFFERQEIKHALAYLRLMQNPDDDNALLRIINFPTRGIGTRSIEQLQEAARAQNIGLWQAASRAGGKVAVFVALIEALRAATQNLPLPEIVDHVLQHSGLVAHYQNETGAKLREAQERLENLNELINAATMFVHENEDDSLTAFLTHAVLEAGEHQAEGNADALHMMTVHAAKGLEFHTVFVGGLEEGLFPHQNSRMERDGLDEERRLMYVAITRAKRRLYLSFAQSRMMHGQVNYSLMSSFLRELPEELLHWITPRVPPRSFGSYASTPQPQARSAPVARPAASTSGWRIGQAVQHAKFGEGVIVNIEGGGADMRVQVNFRNGGSKWLALEYAKLTAV